MFNHPGTLDLLRFLFCFYGVDRGDQHSADGTAVVLQRFILFVRDISGLMQQIQPILRLVAFFQCYLKFRYKVLGTLRILRFVQIRTDGCARSQKLVCQNRFLILCLYLSAKKNNILGKGLCFIPHNTVGQNDHLKSIIQLQQYSFKLYSDYVGVIFLLCKSDIEAAWLQ